MNEEKARVYRIRKSENSSWFFKDWNGREAPAWTLDEAEQIAGRLPGSIVEEIGA